MIPHHSLVGEAHAPHLVFLTHGVLGAGHNLRSLAKRLCERRTDLQVVLIDLRYHGKSLGASPPATLEACAQDFSALSEHLQRAPDAVIGHSLGGKVALTYGLAHEQDSQRLRSLPEPSQLKQVWTLDSDPGAQAPSGHHQVQTVLAALRLHPGPFANRAQATAALTSEGLSQPLAQWLGTSLARSADGLRFVYELEPIGELLNDYFALDYWPKLEAIAHDKSGRGVRYELLVAEESDRWSGTMKEKAAGLNRGGRVRVHTLPKSGHWVHVDNPDGLLALLEANLLRA